MKLFSLSAVALAAALPMGAIAQTATAPAAAPATTATAAAPATTAAAPAATTVVVPVVLQHLDDVSDDAKVSAILAEAGYKDVKLAREGSKLTIDATKDGAATNLVYDTTSGALTTVDGAGYSIDSSAPGMQTGDTNNKGKTDVGGTNNSNT